MLRVRSPLKVYWGLVSVFSLRIIIKNGRKSIICSLDGLLPLAPETTLPDHQVMTGGGGEEEANEKSSSNGTSLPAVNKPTSNRPISTRPPSSFPLVKNFTVQSLLPQQQQEIATTTRFGGGGTRTRTTQNPLLELLPSIIAEGGGWTGFVGSVEGGSAEEEARNAATMADTACRLRATKPIWALICDISKTVEKMQI